MSKMVNAQSGVAVEKGFGAERPPEASPASVEMPHAVSDRRALILDCADEVFLEKGFRGASMSIIAARLGGSKGTLYNYFSSKEELFLASVTRHCANLREQMSSLLSGHDLGSNLHSAGKRYMEVVFSEDVVRKFRMIVGEATRTPELGQAFFETTSGRGARILADYLENCVQDGLLKLDNPMQAARQFISLCDNQFAKGRWCAALPAPSPEQIEHEVQCAVRVFLAAYAVPPQAQS